MYMRFNFDIPRAKNAAEIAQTSEGGRERTHGEFNIGAWLCSTLGGIKYTRSVPSLTCRAMAKIMRQLVCLQRSLRT